MKKLLLIAFLLPVLMHAQTTYHGFYAYTVDASIQILVKFPADTSGTKKFPVIWAMEGNGGVGSDPNQAFIEGLGRQFVNFPSYMPDSIIYVIILPLSNQSALEQPVNQVNCFDKLTSVTSHSDTTNWMLTGLSQGAVNALSAPTWPTGIGFGNGGDYRYNRFKKFMGASTCGLRANAVYSRMAGKSVHMIVGNSDGTCPVAFTNQIADSISFYGGSVTKQILPSPYDHSNTTWDSAYSPKGTDSIHNIYLWAMNKSAYVAPTVKAKVYDWFDFYYAGRDRYNPGRFFDGDITTQGTPRKMQDYYGYNQKDGISGVVHTFTKYGLCRGWFDLSGGADLTDTTKKFKIANFRVYTPGPSGYKAYFFNGDKFLRPTYHERWKGIDDPARYGLIPFDSITSSSGGWVNSAFTVPDSMRYVFVIFTGDTTTQNIFKASEIEFYGQYLFDSSTVTKYPAYYTGAMPNQLTDSTTYGQKNGLNWFNGLGVHSRSMHSKHRLFFSANIGDTALAAGIPGKYKFPLNAFLDINTASIAQMKIEGKEIYLTNQGGSAYDTLINNKSFIYSDTVNGKYSNPDNYKRPADYYKQLTLVLGRQTGGTNKFSTTQANGQDIQRWIALGNERDGHDMFNNLDIFAYNSAVYDGNESSIIVDGMPTGIKNADPNMQVMMSAMVEFDTAELKTQHFYAKQLRADGKDPFDGIDGHKYYAKVDSVGGIVYDVEDKVGSYSSDPERAIDSKHGLTKTLDTMFRRIYRWYPTTIPFWWSEARGRSKYGTVSSTSIQAGSWDESVTPGFGTYDSLSAPAVLNFREILLTCASPVRRSYHYSADNSSGATQQAGRFASMGIAYNRNAGTYEFANFYPDWYVNAGSQGLNNFAFDSWILPESYTSRIQMKFRKPGTDSVCYVTWFGTRNGTSSTQSVYMPSISGNVVEVIPSFTSEIPTSTTLTPSANAVTRTITELPVMYFGREVSVSVVSPNGTIRYRGRIIIHK